jgi:pyrimidine operon attenuation protein / uracil phosphoribosyltransferase
MEKQRIIILDKERVARKLHRMAYEIWEHNSDESQLILIGIHGGGSIVAGRLAAILRDISPLEVVESTIIVNKRNPVNHVLEMSQDLTGKSVVLVDDVANSGKTLLYSLHSLIAYDLKKLVVAVLVDRKHKSFPIACDIVGHTLATTLQEHIEVEIKDGEIEGAYLE